MESSLQKIIAAIVGVMIFFMIPVYVAFEKVDDVTYSLAVKLTQNFVDNVRDKGYISPEMYSDFVSGLYSTNNTYDVEIEHVKKRYDPVLYIYEKVEDETGDEKKGKLLHVLDYEAYKDLYEAGDAIKVDVGIYNKQNAEIDVTEPKMLQQNGSPLIDQKGECIKDDSGTCLDAREVYEKYIEEYKTLGRVIVDKGEIYADVRKVASFDDQIHIPSTIELTKGSIKIKKSGRQGVENERLDYDTFRDKYFEAEKGDGVFFGNTYTNINNVKGYISIDGLDNTQSDKEELYNTKLQEYEENGKIVMDSGEVYVINNKIPDYDRLIDKVADITANGSITVNSPEGWEPNNLDYDKYIFEYLNKGEIEYIQTGEHDVKRTVGKISVGSGNDEVVFDYDSYLDDMLDDNIDIVPITAVFENNDIIFGNPIKVKVTKLDDGYPEVFETQITNMDDIKQIVNRKSVSINGIVYSGDVVFGNNDDFQNKYDDRVNIYEEESNSSGSGVSSAASYEITIILPEMLSLENGFPSDIYILDEQEITEYINEYVTNGNVSYTHEYNKENINFNRESLEVYDYSGNVEYTLYRDLNTEKYDNYISNTTFDSEGMGKTYISDESISGDEIIIDAEISIEGREEKLKINNANLDYLREYYDYGRITISGPKKYIEGINVQHPHIEIKDDEGNVLVDVYYGQDLYEEYVNQYNEKNTVTLKYNVDDIEFVQDKITINKLSDASDIDVVISRFELLDTEYAAPLYEEYKSEYNKKGTITFSAATQYFDLNITDPSVTVRDAQTGEVLLKYDVDYSMIGTSDEWDNIFITREEEYNKNEQIVNETIEYINRDNCFIEKAHIINEEVITDKQIVMKLFKDTGMSKIEFLRQCLVGNTNMYESLTYIDENSYVLNEGDQIQVTVKNRNQTIASVFYSLFTASVGNEEVAKIYVNYGGTVKNSGAIVLKEDTGMIKSEQGRLFKYRGEAEEVVLEPGLYQMECWGAAGGGKTGGRGSYVKGIFEVESETTVYVYVGQKGSEYYETNEKSSEYYEANEENGGFNGGGNSYQGSGGGGATDIRLNKGEWNDPKSLLTRIVVAAGGGGSSKENLDKNTGAGGNGGDLLQGSNGTSLTLSSIYYGLGANVNNISVGHEQYTSSAGIIVSIPESEKGSLGQGGTVDYIGAGAGGSGYFGGSAAHDEYAGGGGGLSYIYDSEALASYKEGHNYPFKASIIDFYGSNVLESALDYIETNGKFKNITSKDEITINGIKYGNECKTGSDVTAGSLSTVIKDAGKGNGYALIKKLD